MRSDAYIRVTCDNCNTEIEIALCATARGGYDERYVDSYLEREGWNCDNDLCPECKTLKIGKRGITRL